MTKTPEQGSALRAWIYTCRRHSRRLCLLRLSRRYAHLHVCRHRVDGLPGLSLAAHNFKISHTHPPLPCFLFLLFSFFVFVLRSRAPSARLRWLRAFFLVPVLVLVLPRPYRAHNSRVGGLGHRAESVAAYLFCAKCAEVVVIAKSISQASATERR